MCALLSSSGGAAAAAAAAATTGPIACNEPMYVIKRDGRKEKVQLDKITKRITAICILYDKKYIDPFAITIPVVAGLYCGVHTSELDSLAAEVAAALVTQHPDYSKIAARILMSNLHKKTENKFSYAIDRLFHAVDPVTKKPAPIISQYHYRIIMENAEVLNNAIVMDRDFDFTYFGLKTLEKSYLLRVNGQIIERPQYLFMRVAIGIHGPNIADAIDTYNWMSLKHFIHATPTLFAAATVRPQLSSCFLLTMQSDSLEGIFDTIKQCGMISKGSGGIGLNLHCIRARGSPISGGGAANGLVPLIRVLNNVARYVDQGGGKRPGAFAVYIEPWHADIIEFLELKRNTGKDEIRARELFYALWIPDLFMKRVLADDVWSLMCPYKCPNLDEVWGTEFETLYMQYEAEGRANSTIPARQLWMIIMQSQVETGMPFLLYKDACNRKSNHQHLGTIKSSNLCTEIIQYSSPEEVAVCNLASIAVNRFVRPEGTYDFRKLYDAVKVVTRNLNKVIDSTTYPVAGACTSNTKHRPIGIGIQGLADAFLLMRFPYESDEARLLNIQIFETLYYAALEASCELAQRDGPYSTYKGSPVSRGILQYDMWDITPTSLWNWNKLRSKINKYGVRNSLLIAPMPTASTAQILGNNESFEPYTSNVYSRRVLSGEYQVINNHLLNDLIKANLWDEDMKTQILANRGSIQNISRIPDAMKQLYKTVWEISVKRCILYAADRGPFIDQSQSFNLHVARPDYSLLTSIHTYSWKMGLKTGCYYIRILPAANAIQYTVDTSTKKQKPTTSTNINADGGIGNQRNTLTNRTHSATTKSIPFNKSVQFTSSSVSSVSSTDNDRASSNSSANLVTANGPITNNNNSNNNNNIDSSYISSRIYESADILSSGSAQYKSIEIFGSNGCESTDTTNNNSSSSSNNCNRKPKKISINVPMPPPPSSVSSSSSLSLSSPLSMSSLSSSTSSVSMLGIVPPSIPIMQCGLNPEDCLSCGS